MTNLRVGTRKRLRIDVDDIRARNPSLIYVRGSAFGARGPDARRGGYDGAVYWSRTGMQQLFTPQTLSGRRARVRRLGMSSAG